MLRLLGLVLSISLADSLNPSTIGPALFLAGGEEPRRRVLGFAAGTFAVFLLGGLILTLGPGRAILALVPRPDATTRYILETIAGAAMLIVGVVLWRRRRRIQERGQDPAEREPGRIASRAGRSPVLVGATIAVVELPTAFPYFAAIAAIVGSGTGLTRQIVLVVIYNVAFVLPLLVIALMLTVFGERTVEILTAVRTWARGRWPTLVGAAALLAGAFVITLGVTGLTSHASGSVGSLSRRLRHIISR